MQKPDEVLERQTEVHKMRFREGDRRPVQDDKSQVDEREGDYHR